MIRLEDVTVAYGSRVILDHIHLTVHDGETLAVLGASGSGKSTVLRLIMGLQKPAGGNIWVHGQNIVDYSEEQLDMVRQHMGMVFQYSALFDSMSVKENIAFGPRQRGSYTESEIESIVADKLHLVGLDGIGDMMPNDLSGGMKKRVSLARAIALNPQIILYDEPTAGLDPIRCMDINRLIVQMQRYFKATSLVVTHDMESAFYVADRLAYLENGKFRLVAPKEEFRHTKDQHVQRFIHGGDVFAERGRSI